MNKMYAIAAAGVVLVGAAIAVSSKNESLETKEKAAKTQQHTKGKKRDKGPRVGRWFKSADVNKDGKLSNDEFHAKHEQYFVMTDTNKDSVLVPQEMKKKRGKKDAKKPVKASRWFKSADANKDGKLSNDEFHAKHEKYFVAVDTNKDGMLTPKEIKTYRDKERAKSRKGKKKQGKKKPPQQKK